VNLKLPQTEVRRAGFAGEADGLPTAGDGDADLPAGIVLLIVERSGVAARARAIERCGLIDLGGCGRARCRHRIASGASL